MGRRSLLVYAETLYRKGDVITFDEASSTLDSGTESKIIRVVESLDKNITIFMITHLFSILRVANK